MQKILTILLFFISQQIYAQTGTIKGKVTSKKPLGEVTVGILGTKHTTKTAQDGSFTLRNIPYGSYTVKFIAFGYNTQEHKIVLDAKNSKLDLAIALKKEKGIIDDVVVTGTMQEVSKSDSPVPIDVYSANFFKSNPTPSIFESLQNVSGVRPQMNCSVCNTGDIHINGLEGAYTMVLIDGMPIVSGLSTVYGFNGIPQSLIERVEVVKGPAATLYGSEAIGGLINIITKSAVDAPLLSADIFGTNWGQFNLDVAGKFKVRKAHALLGVNYYNYTNPIDNNEDNFTDVTLAERISIFNKWDFKRKDDKKMSIAMRYLHEDRWGGDMRWNKSYRGGDQIYGESIYTDRWELLGAYQLPTAEHLTLQVSANGHHQNSVYGDMAFNADQFTAFGQFTWLKMIGKHTLLSGVSLRYTDFDDDTFVTEDEDGNTVPSVTTLPGVFVQDQWNISDRNTLLLGARYDYNNVHGNIFSPRFNYKWNAHNKKTILRLGLGNGYRVANVFTEDHAALTGSRTVEFAEELKPEVSYNANLNFIQKIYPSEKVSLGIDAMLFHTYFTNRILGDFDADPKKVIYDNLDGHSVSQGGTINIEMIAGNFSARVGFTALDIYTKEGDVKERPEFSESYNSAWKLSYNFERIGLLIDYTGNLYGPMRLPLLNDLDTRPENSPWWSIQNIQLTKKAGERWEVYAGVKNLLNFTPAKNSIARSFDPFDRNVTFDANDSPVSTTNNPKALTFDPAYVYAPNQGINTFLGIRFKM